MEVIKSILIDSLNGFSLKDIPLYLFQIIVASLLAHIVQIILNKKWNTKVICNSALIVSSVTVLVSVAKYSLPFSILALGIIFLFKPDKDEPVISKIALLIMGLIGFGCGVGSVFQTLLGVILVILIIFFTPLKKSE